MKSSPKTLEAFSSLSLFFLSPSPSSDEGKEESLDEIRSQLREVERLGIPNKAIRQLQEASLCGGAENVRREREGQREKIERESMTWHIVGHDRDGTEVYAQ